MRPRRKHQGIGRRDRGPAPCFLSVDRQPRGGPALDHQVPDLRDGDWSRCRDLPGDLGRRLHRRLLARPLPLRLARDHLPGLKHWGRQRVGRRSRLQDHAVELHRSVGDHPRDHLEGCAATAHVQYRREGLEPISAHLDAMFPRRQVAHEGR